MAVVGADHRLAAALVARVYRRLDAGQGFVRIPVVASPLPVHSILAMLAERTRIRAAVFVPEFETASAPARLPVTTAVHQAIDWRNDGSVEDDLVVIGDLERDRASGLSDIPALSPDEIRRELFDG